MVVKNVKLIAFWALLIVGVLIILSPFITALSAINPLSGTLGKILLGIALILTAMVIRKV